MKMMEKYEAMLQDDKFYVQLSYEKCTSRSRMITWQMLKEWDYIRYLINPNAKKYDI